MINETTEGQEAGEQREELFFKVIKAGNKILEILAALFIILMLLYGAYSLWDTCQINRRAFISGELMKYKPAGKMDESPSLQELQKINPNYQEDGSLIFEDSHTIGLLLGAIAEDESSGMNYLCETVEGGPYCTIRTEKEAGVGGLLIKNRITPEIAELFTGIPMNNRK